MGTDGERDCAAHHQAPVADQAAALFGRLRALRCRAQSLSSFAADLQTKVVSLADSTARASELTAAFELGRPSFEEDGREIDRLLGEILEILEKDDKLYCAWGDGITAIQVEWQKTTGDRKEGSQTPIADPAHLFVRLIAALDNIVYECCEITIPDRITDHLKLLPIGAALNFRDAYADELPSADQRRRLLQYLNLFPDFVAGLVDVDHERILRASEKRWRRVMSLVVSIAIALSGFGAIALACYLGGPTSHAGDKWPFTEDHLQPYLSAYGFLLLGSVAHVVITLLKQDRAAAESPQPLSNWVLRVHVRETSYFLSALSLWLGAVAMAFLFQGGADWKTAFFLGYSYDSFMDLFIKRFESAVPAVSDLVKPLSAPTA